MNYRVARNFCGSLFLRISDFCVLRQLIFGIRTDCFFFLWINFCDFFLVHAMVIHIFKQYYGVHTPYYVKQVFKLYTALFLNEKDKLQLNRHSGVNFGGQNVSVNFICGNLFLRIAGKISDIRTRKNFVPHCMPSWCWPFPNRYLSSVDKKTS